MKNCTHSSYYTMGNNDAYCNVCHNFLGYFRPYISPFGFEKIINEEISNEYIKQEIERRNSKHYLSK